MHAWLGSEASSGLTVPIARDLWLSPPLEKQPEATDVKSSLIRPVTVASCSPQVGAVACQPNCEQRGMSVGGPEPPIALPNNDGKQIGQRAVTTIPAPILEYCRVKTPELLENPGMLAMFDHIFVHGYYSAGGEQPSGVSISLERLRELYDSRSKDLGLYAELDSLQNLLQGTGFSFEYARGRPGRHTTRAHRLRFPSDFADALLKTYLGTAPPQAEAKPHAQPVVEPPLDLQQLLSDLDAVTADDLAPVCARIPDIIGRLLTRLTGGDLDDALRNTMHAQIRQLHHLWHAGCVGRYRHGTLTSRLAPIGQTMTTLSREIREELCDGLVVELDLVAAQLRIAKLVFDHEPLSSWLEENQGREWAVIVEQFRDSWRETYGTTCPWPDGQAKDVCKTMVYALLYGGNARSRAESLGSTFGFDAKVLSNMPIVQTLDGASSKARKGILKAGQVKDAWDRVLTVEAWRAALKQRDGADPTKQDIARSMLACLAQSYEQYCICKIADAIRRRKGDKIVGYTYDSLSVRANSERQSVLREKVRKAVETANKRFGLRIDVKMKRLAETRGRIK